MSASHARRVIWSSPSQIIVCEPGLSGASDSALRSTSLLALSLITDCSSEVGLGDAADHLVVEMYAGLVRSLRATSVSLVRMSLGHGIAL
eukprot:10710613-Alexandrium_andersonii.AAC.1